MTTKQKRKKLKEIIIKDLHIRIMRNVVVVVVVVVVVATFKGFKVKGNDIRKNEEVSLSWSSNIQ